MLSPKGLDNLDIYLQDSTLNAHELCPLREPALKPASSKRYMGS